MAAGAVEAKPEEHTSLALEHALAPIGSDHGFVLDLGPASGANVSFFAERSCKLFIADLNSSIFGSANPADRAEALGRALDLDIPTSDPFDLILLWDLLDYLDDAEIRILGSRLRPVCHATTLLYGMISIRKEIPDRPSRFEIRNVGSILYTAGSQFLRRSALHKEPELAKLLPDFEVESTYLLRHGMQEYLFRRRRAD
ncbi:MAG: hypothetical protein GY769_01945 [bacterium]|nr:hypothetical protein [bacterium]